MRYRIYALWLAGFAWAAATCSPALDDGIYAVFHTGMGTFTGRLDYAAAPRTVANFVGLAEGSQAWLDSHTGAVRQESFYRNTTFHRVIEGFMIQAGSRAAEDLDGPGYSFPDEIPNGLRHDAAGVISMANSGLNSNGSQFFITAAPAGGLDGLHTVFGHILEGMEVVEAISLVATDADDHPLEDVAIHEIEILRIGEEAQSVSTDGLLPKIRHVPYTGLHSTPEEQVLSFEPRRFGDYYLRLSYDLSEWQSMRYTMFLLPPDSNDLTLTGLGAVRVAFFGLTEVFYPGNDYLLPTTQQKTLTFTFTEPGDLEDLQVTYIFDDENGGDVFLNGTERGSISDFAYSPLAYPHQSTLLIVGDQIAQIDYRMHFTSENSGSFSGIVHGAPPYNEAAGTFTVQH